MADFNPVWDASWTTLINNASINDGASNTSAAQTVDAAAYDLSIECTYGGTANEGIKVYILGDIDGTNFEAVADGAWGIELNYSVSTTFYRRFSLQGLDISAFKVHITNDSGAQVTGVYARLKKAKVQST